MSSPDTPLRVGGKVVAATRYKPIIDFPVDSYFFDFFDEIEYVILWL
jgi:hypothetical protein